MSRIICLFIPALLSFNACSDFGAGLVADSQQVELRCLDVVSNCGNLQVVINSQEEYDQLIYQRFTRPLQDYWNQNYEAILRTVRSQYPGLTDQQYADSVRQRFYQFAPFRGTENCVHPSFDFAHYTLLGLAAHASGCREPDYKVLIYRDDQAHTVTCIVKILTHGSCEMSICRNMWILIPKVPSSYEFSFRKQMSRE